MKKIIFGLLAATITIISCSKDGGTAATVDSYFSVTAGNTWTYKHTNISGGGAVNTYILTSTDKDSAKPAPAGRMYHVFTNSSGPNEYYVAVGNSYYNYMNFSIPAAGINKDIENLYLKADAAVNTTWDQPFSVSGNIAGITVNANLVLTDSIKEKGISKTYNGITYNNVIHTAGVLKLINATAITPLGPTDVTSSITLTSNIQNYYAPNIGLIYSYNKLSVVGSGPAAGLNQNNETSNELQTSVIH